MGSEQTSVGSEWAGGSAPSPPTYMPDDSHPEEAPLLNNTERQAALQFQEEHGEWNVSFHGQTMRWSLNAAVSEANI